MGNKGMQFGDYESCGVFYEATHGIRKERLCLGIWASQRHGQNSQPTGVAGGWLWKAEKWDPWLLEGSQQQSCLALHSGLCCVSSHLCVSALGPPACRLSPLCCTRSLSPSRSVFSSTSQIPSLYPFTFDFQFFLSSQFKKTKTKNPENKTPRTRNWPRSPLFGWCGFAC